MEMDAIINDWKQNAERYDDRNFKFLHSLKMKSERRNDKKRRLASFWGTTRCRQDRSIASRDPLRVRRRTGGRHLSVALPNDLFPQNDARRRF